jgi:hypothetical protein
MNINPEYDHDGEWTSEDGKVLAMITGKENNWVCIDEFSSYEKGKGYAEKALKELKLKFKSITANGIGSEPSHSSWQFWIHMKKKGLVDNLLNDEGDTVTMNQVINPTPKNPVEFTDHHGNKYIYLGEVDNTWGNPFDQYQIECIKYCDDWLHRDTVILEKTKAGERFVLETEYLWFKVRNLLHIIK